MKWDRENPYLFLDVWRRHDAKMESFSKETRSVWERYFGEDNEQSLKLEGKLKKFWKTVLKTQNTRFSRLDQVASQLPSKLQNTCFSRLKWVANKSPGLATKTLKDKIVKNFLSVFRNWKVYPRGSCELSRKNLYVPLTTRPFTREQVAKLNMRARDWSMRLGWPATASPKQDNIVFEIFQFL